MNSPNLLKLSKLVARNLGLSGGRCRYSPTCSAYAKRAFHDHPPFRAAWLTAARLLKCHPWSRGGFDPVP